MSLRIRHIRNAGDLSKERLVFGVDGDTDVGDFAIFRARGDADGNIYTTVSNAFWFSDFRAKAGDQVIVYTKSGKASQKRNDDGSTSYFVYWDEVGTLWDDIDYVPVLVEIATWKAFTRESNTP